MIGVPRHHHPASRSYSGIGYAPDGFACGATRGQFVGSLGDPQDVTCPECRTMRDADQALSLQPVTPRDHPAG